MPIKTLISEKKLPDGSTAEIYDDNTVELVNPDGTRGGALPLSEAATVIGQQFGPDSGMPNEFQAKQMEAGQPPAIHPSKAGRPGELVTGTADVGFTDPEAAVPPAQKATPSTPATPAAPAQEASPQMPSISMGGGVGFGGVAQKQAAAYEQGKKAIESQDTADQAVAEAKRKELESFYADRIDQNQAIENARQVQEKYFQDAQDRDVAFQAELQKANEIRIDPNRYWANKDMGQKAASILAGALFGFVGKGMEYLTRIDDLVQQDVKLQMNQKAMAISNIEKRYDIARHQGDVAARFSQNAVEERIRQAQARYTDLEHMLKAIDVSHLGQQAEARKELALASLAQSYADHDLKLKQVQAAEANNRAHMAMMQMRLMQQQQKQSAPGKQQQQVQEIEGYVANLKGNISRVRQMIQDKGTYELVGPHNEVLDGIYDSIATDMAKLADPKSTARENEVRIARNALPKITATKMSNATALSILDALEERLEERRQNGYKARGLQVAPPINPAIDPSMTEPVE